ncbi:porin family protein [Bacteroidia bacterium]|nr:porin family protein [Bacteroidia bacterium]
MSILKKTIDLVRFNQKNNRMKNILTVVAICIFSSASYAGEPTAKVKVGEPNVANKTMIPTSLMPTKIDSRRNRNHFHKGIQLISLGYGVPNMGGLVFKAIKDGNPDASASGIGPIYLKYEYAMTNNIGLGLVTRYTSSNLEYPVKSTGYDVNGNPTVEDSTYTYGQSITSVGAMARFNYHFSTSRRFDPYVGIGLGYGYSKIKLDLGGDLKGLNTTVKSPIPLATELTIGARYFFSSKIAAYGELGFSQSIANLGLSIAF